MLDSPAAQVTSNVSIHLNSCLSSHFLFLAPSQQLFMVSWSCFHPELHWNQTTWNNAKGSAEPKCTGSRTLSRVYFLWAQRPNSWCYGSSQSTEGTDRNNHLLVWCWYRLQPSGIFQWFFFFFNMNMPICQNGNFSPFQDRFLFIFFCLREKPLIANNPVVTALTGDVEDPGLSSLLDFRRAWAWMLTICFRWHRMSEHPSLSLLK